MTTLDYIVLGAYFGFSVLLGIWFIRHALDPHQSVFTFFLSGRTMPWWLLGTSMVAFSADAPILASRMTAEFGLYFSWMVISLLITATLTTFFFARLWRRSEVLTDVEFLELRYPSKAGRALRAFKAVYLGLFVNSLIIGTQLIAMAEIGEHVIGIDRNTAMLAGTAIALIYAVFSGFLGVVITDCIQSIIAMAGAIILAVYVVNAPAVGGLSGLVEHLRDGITRETPNGTIHVPILNMLPGTDTPFMTLYLLMIPLCISWWSVVYGGTEPGGGGQVAQRMLAARSERDAAGASLWFNFLHFTLRAWPWLLVGLAAVVLYPDNRNFQSVYASSMRDYLPSGMRGVLVASFFAAFISTMDSRLNLGGSYLVNDLYKRFLRQNRDEAHYVRVSRLVTVLLCIVPFAVPYFLGGDILHVVLFWMEITAGTGLVYILRWYWWRINAWSEISAMLSAILYTLLLIVFKYGGNMELYMASPAENLKNIAVVTVLVTITWVIVTLLTRPEPREGLETFYRRTRPAGPGWRKVAAGCPGVTSPDDLRIATIAWISASIFLFACFYGTGKLLLQDYTWGGILMAICAVSLATLLSVLKRVFA